MKALRILILVLTLPVFVSAVLADASDQGGGTTRTLKSAPMPLTSICFVTSSSNPPCRASFHSMPSGPRLVHTPSPTKAR